MDPQYSVEPDIVTKRFTPGTRSWFITVLHLMRVHHTPFYKIFNIINTSTKLIKTVPHDQKINTIIM